MPAANVRRQRSATLRLLERLGVRPIPLDRTAGSHPFAIGGHYAECPACGLFAGVLVDGDDRTWRSQCGCFGWRPLDELDLMMIVRRAA